jgi:uncharacterized nucleotidyltransferase DUF6036
VHDAHEKSLPSKNSINFAVNDPLRTTLADAVEFLKQQHVQYALVGGLASSIRGQTRVTADVDMVLAIDVTRALALLESVAGSKFMPLFADAAEVVEKSFILPLRHRATGVKLDLAIGLSGFEQQAISRAQILDIGGISVPVITAEDLLVMKVLAGRPQDVQDAAGIVQAQSRNLDWNHCLTVGKELGDAVGQNLVALLEQLRGSVENE